MVKMPCRSYHIQRPYVSNRFLGPKFFYCMLPSPLCGIFNIGSRFNSRPLWCLVLGPAQWCHNLWVKKMGDMIVGRMGNGLLEVQHRLFIPYSHIFSNFSQLIPDLFRASSLEHYFIMTCSLFVHGLFMTCS